MQLNVPDVEAQLFGNLLDMENMLHNRDAYMDMENTQVLPLYIFITILASVVAWFVWELGKCEMAMSDNCDPFGFHMP